MPFFVRPKGEFSMTVMKNFKILAILLALLVPASMAAAPKSGKVRLVIGDVKYQKQGKSKWTPLRVDGKVQEKDIIKTETESTVSIAFPDGSVVAVAERSEVEFSQLLYNDGSQISTIDIKEGQLRFDVQKQKGDKSSFTFKTGTATCSIRGTDGVVGVTKDGQVIGSLNSGAMDMEQNGKVVNVKPKQFVVLRKNKPPVVGEAANAGDMEFMKQVAKVVEDTTKSDAEIVSTAKQIDKKIDVSKEGLKDDFSCRFDGWPAVSDTNAVVFTALCTPGMTVTIGAETLKSTGEKLTFSPDWAKNSFGDKKFVVTCTAGNKTFECGRLSTTYKIDRIPSFGAVDEKKCTAEVKTKGFDENKGALKVLVGDSLLQQLTLDRDTTFKFNTLPGNRSYTLDAENMDANVGKATATINCLLPASVSIEIKGDANEVVKKKVSQGAFMYPVLEFTVNNVPGNDPAQIKSVMVKSDDKTYETKFAPSKTGIAYRSTLRLPRGKTSFVDIIVTMKNGDVITAKKSYEIK